MTPTKPTRAEFRSSKGTAEGCFEERNTPEIGASFEARHTPCKAKLVKISQPERWQEASKIVIRGWLNLA